MFSVSRRSSPSSGWIFPSPSVVPLGGFPAAACPPAGGGGPWGALLPPALPLHVPFGLRMAWGPAGMHGCPHHPRAQRHPRHPPAQPPGTPGSGCGEKRAHRSCRQREGCTSISHSSLMHQLPKLQPGTGKGQRPRSVPGTSKSPEQIKHQQFSQFREKLRQDLHPPAMLNRKAGMKRIVIIRTLQKKPENVAAEVTLLQPCCFPGLVILLW